MMKIVFLNAWYGEKPEELATFFKEQVHGTDLFCLQEASGAVKSIYKDILTDFQEVYEYKYISETDDFHQITLVKNGIDIVSSKSVFKDDDTLGLTLHTELKTGDGHFHLCNVHGSARPSNKLDSPGRLMQSKTLIDLFKDEDGPIIIGGDFNIELETESVEMFARSGYHNLIKDFQIETTRNHLAWDRYPDNKLYYSDYVFTNNKVTTKNFSVIDNRISDHLPMILEFEL